MELAVPCELTDEDGVPTNAAGVCARLTVPIKKRLAAAKLSVCAIFITLMRKQCELIRFV